VEHSWCEILPEKGISTRTRILDPYAVGRLPQVQLIDTFACLCHTHDPSFPSVSQLYRRTSTRDDIREDALKKMNEFLDRHFKPRLNQLDALNEKVESRRK
jgi:hypothetical protein